MTEQERESANTLIEFWVRLNPDQKVYILGVAEGMALCNKGVCVTAEDKEESE